MIPISDQPGEGRRSTPVVTVALVAVNVLVFLYELGLGGGLDRFIFAWGVVPFEISSGRDLPPAIPYPVYVTLITSMFLHGGLLHIAGNMLFLWVFGDNVEDYLGHLRFIVFYFAAGIAAGLGQVLVDPLSRTPGVGASGAIAAVLAAYLVLFPSATVRTLVFLGPFITVTRLSAYILIGLWIILQFISGVAELSAVAADGGGVAYWAHIGGFVAGLVMILIFKRRRRPRWRY